MKSFKRFLIIGFLFSSLYSIAFAQTNTPNNINTFVVEIDPASKTKLVFTVHESDLRLAARNLSELVNSLPNNAELNLFLGTQENQNEITKLLTKDLPKAVERGVAIKVIPFDVHAAEAAMRSSGEAVVADLATVTNTEIEALSDKEVNERNTVITTRKTIASFARDARNLQWKGLITATVITGAGANVLGPSWVFAADVPVSYQITSFFVSAVMLYWMPRKSESINNFYRFSYEMTRTARYLIPTLISRDYVVPEPTARGQAITTAFTGGVLVSYSIQSLLTGLAVGFDILSYPEFQSVLIRNSLFIGAASTPWSVLAHNLRTRTGVTDAWTTTIRTMSILGIGLGSVYLPGITENYLRGYSLNWAEYIMLATGATGILANKYGISFLNRSENSLWFQYLNRNMEYLANLPENAIRLLRGQVSENPYWSTKRVKRDLNRSMCTKFLAP